MSPITEKEMYTLGQLTRCVWTDGEVPTNILSLMLAYPTKGIGMAHNTDAWRKADQEEIARISRWSLRMPPGTGNNGGCRSPRLNSESRTPALANLTPARNISSAAGRTARNKSRVSAVDAARATVRCAL